MDQEWSHVYNLLARTTAIQPVLVEDLKRATQQLRIELENRRRNKVALRVPDKGRRQVSWPKYYETLHQVFANSGVMVHAYHFLTCIEKVALQPAQMNL